MSLQVATHPISNPHGFEHHAPKGDSGFASVRKLGTIVHFKRNDAIFDRGDHAGYVYKVISGAVRLSRVTQDGHRWIADFALAGDLFGFDVGDTYTLAADAIGEVTAVRYLRSQIDRAGDEQTELRHELMSILRRGLCEAQNHLMILTRQMATERVASFLIRLVDRANAEDGDAVEVSMRRQDIAGYLGLTTETVCRAVSEFCRAGIIEVPNRRQIIVHSVDKLRARAGDDD